MILPTVKITTKNEQGFMIINESDFDAAKDKLFTGIKSKAEKKKASEKKKDKPKQFVDDALNFDSKKSNSFSDI